MDDSNDPISKDIEIPDPTEIVQSDEPAHLESKGEVSKSILSPKSILWPFKHLNEFGREDNLKLIFGSFFGLFPLAVVMALSIHPSLAGHGYWLLAFYFATLWAVFFKFILPSAHPGPIESVCLFYGVGLYSTFIVPELRHVLDINHFKELIQSGVSWKSVMGHWLYTGIPEELVKITPLLMFCVFSQSIQNLSTIIFLGLLSGLGFGIYEGVEYQKIENLKLAESPEEYHILNIMRLTSLPFLHAMWTGTAAFFLGVSLMSRNYRLLYIPAGLLVPSLLHGLYNHFGNTTANFGLAIISVILFNLILVQTSRIERKLVH